jgi:hypothetical protein
MVLTSQITLNLYVKSAGTTLIPAGSGIKAMRIA